MANSSDIAFVIDSIEADHEEHGWDESSISDRLDAGAIKERVVAAYWRMRASETISLVNTSESGSSRGMDSVYPRMKALADEWDARAVLVETPPAAARPRLSSFPIRRV